MARRTPLRKVTYFEPVPARLARNTIIESTFRRFRYTIRVDSAPTKRSLRTGAVAATRSISLPR